MPSSLCQLQSFQVEQTTFGTRNVDPFRPFRIGEVTGHERHFVDIIFVTWLKALLGELSEVV